MSRISKLFPYCYKENPVKVTTEQGEEDQDWETSHSNRGAQVISWVLDSQKVILGERWIHAKI